MKAMRRPGYHPRPTKDPQHKEGSDVMIHHDPTEHIEVMVMFRIISRHDWDVLQRRHKACPGSTVEHLYRGLYVLTIPASGACEEAA